MKWTEEIHESIIQNSTLMKLIYTLLMNVGMISDLPDWNEDWSKVKNFSAPGPGARVEIYWKDEYKLEPDHGYIFTLPSWDSNDIFMSGIVHIPRPNGCEKCECDPEWHLLAELTSNELIKEIIIRG